MAEAAESNTSTKLSSNPANDPGPSSSGIASSSGKPEEVRVGEERKDSCTPKFDALWFCYSPGYQLQQYYIHGRVDDCSFKWTEFMDCLKKKTKFKDEVLKAEQERKHPLWELRTHKEAQESWQQEFGHLGGGAARQPGDAADSAQSSGRQTLV